MTIIDPTGTEVSIGEAGKARLKTIEQIKLPQEAIWTSKR